MRLRNDELVKILNKQNKRIKELIKELSMYEPVIFKHNGQQMILYELVKWCKKQNIYI